MQIKGSNEPKSKLNLVGRTPCGNCGATMSFITLKKAKKAKLKGIPVEFSEVKVGGNTKKIKSYKYELPLIDKNNQTVYCGVWYRKNNS